MRHPNEPSTGDRSPVASNVVDFNRRLRLKPVQLGDEAFIQSKPFGKRAPHCSHKQAWVDPHNRTVECRACGAVLDPFDYLMEIVHEGNRLVRMYDAINRARTQVRELEDEERKLKGRVRSWREKAKGLG